MTPLGTTLGRHRRKRDLPMSSTASWKNRCQLCGNSQLEEFAVPNRSTWQLCRHCRLYQYGPADTVEGWDDETYHQGNERNRNRKLRTATVRLNRVGALVKGWAPRLLDLGCGIGNTLEAAVRRGWRAVGVEVSRRSIRKCRERGFDCYVIDGHRLPFTDESFDVATAWSVIEHVVDVRQTLDEVWRILRVGGVLAMDTSNAACLKVRLLQKKYRRFWVPGHTYAFSPKTLGRFLEEAGFTVVRQPFLGRWSDLSSAMACYAVGYQTQYELRRILGVQKAFQIFARKDSVEPVRQYRNAA
jgi:ubiquinone/menaquinone biosynthesis C-methylase UbiE